MYIFQPDRFLLEQQIKSFSSYITGITLDIGAGHYNRYGKFFSSAEKIIRMDINHAEHVDIVGSADSIPLENESVDSVVCTQVFEHVKYPDRCAQEIYRVLKKGGYALITVPQMNELHEEPHDYFRYTRFGLDRIFLDTGFSIVKAEARGGFYATLAQMIIRYCIDSFNLYDAKFLGKIFGKFLYISGKLALFVDKRFSGQASRKHTIGWSYVIKK